MIHIYVWKLRKNIQQWYMSNLREYREEKKWTGTGEEGRKSKGRREGEEEDCNELFLQLHNKYKGTHYIYTFWLSSISLAKKKNQKGGWNDLWVCRMSGLISNYFIVVFQPLLLPALPSASPESTSTAACGVAESGQGGSHCHDRCLLLVAGALYGLLSLLSTYIWPSRQSKRVRIVH